MVLGPPVPQFGDDDDDYFGGDNGETEAETPPSLPAVEEAGSAPPHHAMVEADADADAGAPAATSAPPSAAALGVCPPPLHTDEAAAAASPLSLVGRRHLAAADLAADEAAAMVAVRGLDAPVPWAAPSKFRPITPFTARSG